MTASSVVTIFVSVTDDRIVPIPETKIVTTELAVIQNHPLLNVSSETL